MSADKESSYMNMSELDEEERYTSSAPIPNYRCVRYQPGNPNSGRYPKIPLSEIAEAMRYDTEQLEIETERLRQETAETEELCKKISKQDG
jgi:hypothetical protein